MFFGPKIVRRSLSELLPWGEMRSPDIILTKQAEYMAVFAYQPPDLAASSPEQLVSARHLRNKAIMRLPERWAVWFEARRRETRAYACSTWPDPVSAEIDRRRRETFTSAGTQFATRHYVTLLYSPPDKLAGELMAHFDGGGLDENPLGTFRRGIDEFAQHMPDARRLAGGALLEFLHDACSVHPQRVRIQPFPVAVSEYLADCEYLGGRRPMLDDHHLRCVRIAGIVTEETSPDIFSALSSLPFAYRRWARWLPVSRDTARGIMEGRRADWANKRVPLMVQMLSAMRIAPDDGTKHDKDAEARMDLANDALVAINGGLATFGFWTAGVVVSDRSSRVAEEQAQEIARIIRADGFLASVARDDATSVWVGSIPGCPHGDLGRFLGPSPAFADIMPSTAIWEGPERDEHLNGPVMLRGRSDGGTPFSFALHQPGSDVGHMLIVGQTGAGKSVLLSSMIAAYRRYPNSRVIVLDRNESSKCITLALGGEFHALAADDAAVSLQPLARVDDDAERAWAHEWALGCLEEQGFRCDAEQQEAVHTALVAMAGNPIERRTMTLLRALVQCREMKAPLGTFCRGGALGDLLDNDHWRMGNGSDVTTYETAALVERASAVAPVMACVFREIERGFDGRPTLLVIDEAWAILDNPMMAGKLRSWLKTARKANVQVVMATQSLEDVRESSIRSILAESCHTRVFTANNAAQEPAIAETYRGFGLTDEQIRIVAQLRPKREYVFQVRAPAAWRTFELALTPYELAFVGSSRPEDRKAMDRILSRHPREQFAEQWLRHRGIGEPQISQEAAE